MAKQKEEKKELILPTPALPAIVETVGATAAPTYTTVKKEYDVTQHDVFNEGEGYRPKKKVRSLRKDAEGKAILGKDNKPLYDTKRIEVNRIGVPLQELIVRRRVSFMNVSKVQLEANPQTDLENRLYQMVKKIRDDNKLSFIEKEIARRMLSELQVAKLWYSEAVELGYWGEIAPQAKFKMRCKVLSPELGDTLLPVFDDFGKMVYFGRIYESSRSFSDLINDADFTGLATQKDQRFDVFSDSKIYKFRKARNGETVLSTTNNNGWILDDVIAHSYGKIPVIYYSKPMPPWASVQAAIARIETLVSNVGDTNDYHASPVFAMFGNVGAKMLEKGEQGKSLQITGDKADAKYVTWDQATDAIKMELDTLMSYIFTCTQTPQMSMDDLKGLGAASGVAYDRIFMDAHLAARDEIDGDYGMSTQRDINLQVAFCGAIDTRLVPATKSLTIGFDIPIFRINDDSETVGLLQKAAGGAKVISQKTAIEYSPLTKNADEEIKQIEMEEAAQAELTSKEKAANDKS